MLAVVAACAVIVILAAVVVLLRVRDDGGLSAGREELAAAVREEDRAEVAALVERTPELLDGTDDVDLDGEQEIDVGEAGYGSATVELEEDVEYTVHRPTGAGLVILDAAGEPVRVDGGFVAASDGDHTVLVADGRTAGTIVIVVAEVRTIPIEPGETEELDLPRGGAAELTFGAEEGVDYRFGVVTGDGYRATVFDEDGAEVASNHRSDPDYTDFEAERSETLTVRVENDDANAGGVVTLELFALADWTVFAGDEADPYHIAEASLTEFEPGLDPDRQVLTWCFFVAADVAIEFTIERHDPLSEWTLIEFGSEASREAGDEIHRFEDAYDFTVEAADDDRVLCYDLDLTNDQPSSVTVEVTELP